MLGSLLYFFQFFLKVNIITIASLKLQCIPRINNTFIFTFFKFLLLLLLSLSPLTESFYSLPDVACKPLALNMTHTLRRFALKLTITDNTISYISNRQSSIKTCYNASANVKRE